jgi:hypothetical protein
VVAHAFNPSTRESEAGGFMSSRGQPGLQSEFQDSQGYIEKPCLGPPPQKKRITLIDLPASTSLVAGRLLVCITTAQLLYGCGSKCCGSEGKGFRYGNGLCRGRFLQQKCYSPAQVGGDPRKSSAPMKMLELLLEVSWQLGARE